MNYSDFKPGDRLVIVNNPDLKSQNGSVIEVVSVVNGELTAIIDSEPKEVIYRRTQFRPATKLDKALK